MGMQQSEPGELAFDLADRMRKALRVSGVGVQEMADYLDVGRNTVSTWINGRVEPSTQTQRLWALRTGVPFDWLRTGTTATEPDIDPGGGSNTEGDECAIRDSNPEPADSHETAGQKPLTLVRTAA